jgi:transcription elongation factor GreA
MGPIDPGGSEADDDPMTTTIQTTSLITHDGERALRGELARLRHELEVGFASRLRDAREFGDAAGNDDYLQIKEEETVLAAGIARLQALLATATVVDEADLASGVAVIGTLVVVRDVDSGLVDEHLLIGGYEALSPNAVSANSPVGRALMGRTAGDEVEVELPGHRKRRLRVVAVRPGGQG